MATPRKATPTRRQPKAAITSHELQAKVEGVPVVPDDKVELKGKLFRRADKIGMMPLLRFAHVSAKGIDSSDMEGLAAIYDMVKDAIDAEDWAEFQQHATDTKAEADDLLGIVKQVIEGLAQGRTGSQSDSSPGRPTTSEKSKASSPRTGSTIPEPPGGFVSVDSLLDR